VEKEMNNEYNKNLQPFANKLRHNMTNLSNLDFVTSIIQDKIEELKKIHPLPDNGEDFPPPAPASGGDFKKNLTKKSINNLIKLYSHEIKTFRTFFPLSFFSNNFQ